MLTRIIELSLRHRLVVVLLAAVAAAWGVVQLIDLPMDAFPDTTPTQVTVNTVAPALTPEEIERQITRPVELAMGGLPQLAELRSVSKYGFSQVTLVFEDGMELYLARQVVSERLQGVEVPPAAGRPTLGPVSTGLGEVFQYTVRSDRHTAMELRTLHDWEIRPRMLAVPGVAEINTWGGYERQVHVVVDPARLLAWGLRVEDIERALRENSRSAGGGVVGRGGEARLVQGVGLATTLEDFERIVVEARQGRPVLISDVARVEEGWELRRGAASAGGRGEVVLGLGFMRVGAHSGEVTRALEERLAELGRDLPEGVVVEPVYARTTLVDEVLDTVRANLLEGALLVIAVLFILMGDLRAGLIVALAIPLSMAFAFDLMARFGVAGSLMSLGAIDFGLVVDSAVITVENAHRRLQAGGDGADEERSVVEIVRDAAVEVRGPTLYGELIIMAVYLPILTLEGVEGRLFRPMALTVIFALLGSMVLSVTLMPALASLVLKRGKAGRGEPWVVRGLRALYRPVLELALRRRVAVVVLAALVVGNGALLATRLGAEFVPRLQEQAVVVNTVRLAGVSLEESVRYGGRIERRLKERFPDELAHVWTRTGTAEVATDPMGLELSDVFITLTPRERWTRASTQAELVALMRAELEGMPGMRMIFTQPIEMRVNEMNAGIRGDIGVKVYGADFDRLREAASQVQRAVAAVPGAADVTVEQLTGQPILQIEVDRQALSRLGASVEQVMALIEMLGMRKIGEVWDQERRFDVVLRLDERYLQSVEAVSGLLVVTARGERVPLDRVARLREVDAPSSIQREQGRRRIVVQANASGRDPGSFAADVQRAVDALELPEGCFVGYGGQHEQLARAQRRLLIVVPLALALIFALLLLTYGRLRDALRVFTGVPFAAVGGVLALHVRDLPFSISAAVGFVAVSGVAVLGDMVLASRVRQLEAAGVPLLDAVRQAAQSRLRPVLMTALVAALGFVPMALNTGIGAEVQRPLATVVIGGVVTSTLATLVVLPALYALFAGGRASAAQGPFARSV